MTKQVFAYGSLSEGMVHFHRIAGAVQNIKKAWIFGAAYQLRVGYPVLLKESTQKISGHLIELNSSQVMIPLLDSFYGYSALEPKKCLHFRELILAELANGETSESWVYFLNPEKLPATATLIEDGDWESKIRLPKFTDQLTDRQKNYLRRLGSVSAREVLPIDLPLYRELMNLELIVDKGRRLALSKFGQEVCRYLEA